MNQEKNLFVLEKYNHNFSWVTQLVRFCNVTTHFKLSFHIIIGGNNFVGHI